MLKELIYAFRRFLKKQADLIQDEKVEGLQNVWQTNSTTSTKMSFVLCEGTKQKTTGKTKAPKSKSKSTKGKKERSKKK